MQLAHDNQILALNHNEAQALYEKNKLHFSDIVSFLKLIQQKFEETIAENGQPTFHYALGDDVIVFEFRELLEMAFASLNDVETKTG